MKRIGLIIILFMVCSNFSLAQEEKKYFHLGVIPYQVLLRSSGIYAGLDLTKGISIEYRPTYTIATRFSNWGGFYLNSVPPARFLVFRDLTLPSPGERVIQNSGK